MVKQLDKDLAAQLLKQGLLTEQSVEKYLKEIDATNAPLRTYLVHHAIVSEKTILEAMSAVLNVPMVDLKMQTIDPAVIAKVPVRFAWYYKFMPVKIDNKAITLACTIPPDVKIQDEIRVHLGLEPKIVLAKESDIIAAQNKYYGLAADMIDRLSKETLKAPPLTLDSVENLEPGAADDASVSRLVNQILLDAYKKRATDIHIEPYRKKVRIRYRIDGVLVDANVPQSVKQFILPVISRIKIIANLSIVEKRLPQDGSAVVRTKEQDLDLRISTIPTPHGESMVIRILPTNVMLLSLEKLGLNKENLHAFRTLVQKPHGIVLVTGPTGSGKTTTLYACLNEINSSERKIITLEDPLEYELEGITQIQVNPKVNLTFAAGLRSILRHDPDIIMVGEIRDIETAEIAIRTALTGHLVFSTLHTNDAASGITRLVEMGLEPYLVASSVEAFVAQRLLRLVCSNCRVEEKAPLLEIREEMAKTFKIPKDEVKIFTGKGCDQCNGTGYYGRTAIYEILVINEEIRNAILDKQGADHIKRLAMKNGMRTLRQDGWGKVLNGSTSPMEVLKTTEKDLLPENPAPAAPAPSPAAVTAPADIPSGNASVEPLVRTAVSASSSAPAASPAGSVVPAAATRVVTDEILSAANQYNSRVYPRLKAKIPIRYAIMRQDKNDPLKLITDKIEHSSITKDISAGGIRFVTGYTLPVGTILEMKIQLEKDARSIDCLAKVCRVEDDNLSAMYNLITYFLDISSAERVKIGSFVKSELEKLEEKNKHP